MLEITSTKRDVHWIKGLVYGPPGIGKTVLLSTAPKPIIISAEGGLLSLAKKDIAVIEVNSLNDVREAYKLIRASEFETIGIDSLSELAEIVVAEYKKEEKDPRRAYGRMADEMIELTRRFRDLPERHVIFTSKIVKEKDEDTGIISYEPMMPGKAFGIQLPYFFDLILCMRAGKDDDGNMIRYCQTQPDMRYTAKDRSGNLNSKEEPNLTLIFEKMRGN